jgi:hypothetical protein
MSASIVQPSRRKTDPHDLIAGRADERPSGVIKRWS